MKIRNLIFLAVFATGFVACDELEEASTIVVSTKFDIEVPVAPDQNVSVALKSVSADEEHLFSGQADFNLANNPDLAASVNKIKSLVLNGGSVDVPQLSSPNEILTMTIEVYLGTQKIVGLTKTNLTASSNTFTSEDIAALTALQNQLSSAPGETYTFKLNGKANYPVDTTVKVKFNSDVKASIL
ncbi:MAG TPA: hypothetical protein PLK12_04905 [Prolixibacteraceae bacterium]|nr:hypothetical protein [Prolixibacteraceae bacterium]